MKQFTSQCTYSFLLQTNPINVLLWKKVRHLKTVVARPYNVTHKFKVSINKCPLELGLVLMILPDPIIHGLKRFGHATRPPGDLIQLELEMSLEALLFLWGEVLGRGGSGSGGNGLWLVLAARWGRMAITTLKQKSCSVSIALLCISITTMPHVYA